MLNIKKRKILSNSIIIGIFLAGIYGFTVASIVAPVKGFSESENRVLTGKPTFTIERLLDGSYTKDYETFITDQFVLRDKWIGIKTRTELALQKKDINGVYFGKDDYLITKLDETDVDQAHVDKNITRVESFIAKYSGILGNNHVRAMVVPTAFDILEDKLPLFATGYSQDSVLDRLSVQLSEQWVELRDVLKSHSSEYIFYRTDHHWTTLGAYYAYEEWAKSCDITPLRLEDFDIRKVDDAFYGTTYSKVNIPVKPDDMYIFDSGNKFKVEYNMSGIIKDTLYEMDKLETKDKYTVYLNGNNALVEINSELNNGRKLLIIKDSYAHCFAPFAANHFETTYMIDFRYFNMPVSSFINEYGITDILFLYNANSFVEDKNIYNLTR